MSDIIGKQIEIGVGVETVRGTAKSTAEKWAKKTKATVVERAEKAIDASTRGRIEDSIGARIVRKWVEGTLEGNLHADLVGFFLYNIYGAVASTNPATGVYSHAFTVANSIQHASLSLYAKDGSVQQRVFAGAMVKELTIGAAIDEYVNMSVGFLARTGASNAASPTYAATEYDFVARDITLKFADTEGALGAATAIKAKDIEIAWSQNLTPNHVIGAYTPDDIYNVSHAIEIKFSRAFTDTTFKDLFLANTYKYVSVSIIGEADLGSGQRPTLTLILNRAQILDWNRDGAANALVSEPVRVKAFYNETDGEMSSVTLINKTSEYDVPLSA